MRCHAGNRSLPPATEMHCHSYTAPLCRLINDSLRSLTEPQLSPLTKETEKHLLIILSQISRQIRGLDEDDSDVDLHNEKDGQDSDSFHDCLPNIGDNLDEYLRLLCACLEVSMSKVVCAPTIESGGDSSRFILYVRKTMAKGNWDTVTGILQVLRTILKHLKKSPDGEHMELYLNSVNLCLTNISWELLGKVLDAQDSEEKMGSGKHIVGKFGSPFPRFVFIGILLQLFCSVAHQSNFEEDGILSEHPILCTTIRLVPKLLSWCFHTHEDGNWTSKLQYLRHKMLMLMIRLSFLVTRENSMLVLWLQLLRKHFQDLLHQPISKSRSDHRDCLDGSPFCSSIADGKKDNGKYIHHLQRQAIYLFLKCSFGLINLGKEVGLRCSCATLNSCVTHNLQSGQECCSWKKGLLELSEWLGWHVPLDMVVDYEIYLEKCSCFASSFLQLYMDEDDHLFEVLLQLSTLPFPVQKMDYKERGNAYKDLKGEIIFHLSNVFGPVHLFHLLLAELHYDHSVLLDYLISKDAGVRCLQYLLSS